MASGQPDHTKVTLMKGTDPSGNLVTVAVDANGNIVGIFKGEDPSGALKTLATDSSGKLKAGVYGDQDVLLATDANGKLIAVIKGEYEGSSKTLATDEEGRLLAKITDSAGLFEETPSLGMHNLASITGDYILHDRRGLVYWKDNFAEGLNKWFTFYGVAGDIVEIVTDTAYVRGYCVHIHTTADANSRGAIYRLEPFKGDANFGVAFSGQIGEKVGTLVLWAEHYSIDTFYDFRFRVDNVNNNLDVYDSASTWFTVDSNLPHISGMDAFHNFKLVCDPTNTRYSRLILNQHEYDLTAISPPTSDNFDPTKLKTTILISGTADGACDSYIDNVLLTYKEP